MKKFNRIIKAEVSVDYIANMLLSTLKEDNPHRELIAETIVGNMLKANKLHTLLGPMIGYKEEINFKVGDKLVCTASVYDYAGQAYNSKNGRNSRPLGFVVVKSIDEYADEPITVEYDYYERANENGPNIVKKEAQVKLTDLKAITDEDIDKYRIKPLEVESEEVLNP